MDDVRIDRIRVGLAKERAAGDAWILGAAIPRRTAVVRAEKTRVDNHVNAIAFGGWRNSQTDRPATARRQAAAAQLRPSFAGICRLEDERFRPQRAPVGRIDLQVI